MIIQPEEPDPNPGLPHPWTPFLSPIPKPWVLSSHVIFLVLSQAFKTMIPLAGGPRFVLVHAVEDAEDGEDDGADLAAQVDRVPGVVLWPVAFRICPSVGSVLASLSLE